MNSLDLSPGADLSGLWGEVAPFWPELPWPELIPGYGAYHRVALFPGRAVIRVSTGLGHERRARREHANATAVGLLDLPVPTPGPIGRPVVATEWTACAIDYLPGRRRQDEEWDVVGPELTRVLAELRSVPLPVSAGLRPVRDWCGGPEWPAVVERIAAPLGRTLRRTAIDAAAAVLEVERDIRPVFVHGDFGMHNLLWLGGRIAGVLDLDTACAGDPAIDVAQLLGAFDPDDVERMTGAAVFARAVVHKRTLPLQVAAAADLAGDAVLRDHALSNFVERLDEI
ncbi:phosphotransferase family protein [Lacisediminihabitans changchengi]|uniref:Aminoglycoside phosphotransferase family protein n=1 Tax=Lacisediminihabitans changchengi TaxID=2787634 RepID=A0A934W2N9_9MICO|nr:aminoglycoside phosphotransferase family protein [Lacisediminihabitans changchengi]MBK4346769.1 aminoglycoside phosphotransferase family protein [Lacisediminihabitans changchengi]MBK4348108.1 aminoglycoside phosphotransferase family protein [Lacisediminihabitans changchengi]